MLRLATAAVVGGLLVRGIQVITCRRDRLRVQLWLGGLLAPRGVVLRGVKVPQALIAGAVAVADDEGLVACDVQIVSGNIVGVWPAGRGPASLGTMTIPAATGSILFGCFCDPHTHMVKTHTVPRNPNPTGSINDALRCELCDVPRWSEPGDVRRRMSFALRTSYHHGARAVRTHLDGTNSDDPQLRQLIYDEFAAQRATWAAKGLVVQGVANLYLPLYLVPELAERHAREAAGVPGVLLGAYCGNVRRVGFDPSGPSPTRPLATFTFVFTRTTHVRGPSPSSPHRPLGPPHLRGPSDPSPPPRG